MRREGTTTRATTMRIMTRLFLWAGEKGSGFSTVTAPSLWPLKTM